jgi:hypothetical protein
VKSAHTGSISMPGNSVASRAVLASNALAEISIGV